MYREFFLELYGWTWSLYTSCIPQLKKKKKKCERREIQLLKGFLTLLKGRVFFFFFFLKKANIKGRVEAAN